MSDTLAKVRRFVLQDLLRSGSADISDDLNLNESGMLSSLSIVRLVAFVEDEFAVDVGVSDPRTRFTSIRNIASYVDEKNHEK